MTVRSMGPSLLFCPADRPERYRHAAHAADIVILDLEDGVNSADRMSAREFLASSRLDPNCTVVRVSAVGSSDHDLDMQALNETNYFMVMLAKTESDNEVASLAPREVIALCETARGVQAADSISACDAVIGLMWGAEDLVSSLGGRSSRDRSDHYRDVARYARSRVLFAARANDRFAIDAVHVNIPDLEGLRVEAEDAAASGFSGTACIHPSQVAIVRAAYNPLKDEVEWARRVIDQSTMSRGAFQFDGKMVDAPVLRHAEAILEFARRSPPSLRDP